jgi:hypothetical protein
MKQEKDETKEKKFYVKPELTQVKLVVGEAVLGFCKTQSGVLAECELDPCILISGYRS